ncbi:hypothetical protein HWI79_1807 [Cryptosporidium felis]|nr:hypothetical protein HWI79_1807 [Cryptosporidium felis]
MNIFEKSDKEDVNVVEFEVPNPENRDKSEQDTGIKSFPDEKEHSDKISNEITGKTANIEGSNTLELKNPGNDELNLNSRTVIGVSDTQNGIVTETLEHLDSKVSGLDKNLTIMEKNSQKGINCEKTNFSGNIHNLDLNDPKRSFSSDEIVEMGKTELHKEDHRQISTQFRTNSQIIKKTETKDNLKNSISRDEQRNEYHELVDLNQMNGSTELKINEKMINSVNIENPVKTDHNILTNSNICEEVNMNSKDTRHGKFLISSTNQKLGQQLNFENSLYDEKEMKFSRSSDTEFIKFSKADNINKAPDIRNNDLKDPSNDQRSENPIDGDTSDIQLNTNKLEISGLNEEVNLSRRVENTPGYDKGRTNINGVLFSNRNKLELSTENEYNNSDLQKGFAAEDSIYSQINKNENNVNTVTCNLNSVVQGTEYLANAINDNSRSDKVNNTGKKKLQYTGNRTEELKMKLEEVQLMKSNTLRVDQPLLNKPGSSEIVHVGIITQIDLFEELLKYLLRTRNLIEEVYEDENIEGIMSEEIKKTYEWERDNEGEGISIVSGRTTVSENIVKFAAKLISINLHKVEEIFPKFSVENNQINSYYDLIGNEVIFFQNTAIQNELSNSYLISISNNETSAISIDYDLNESIIKIKNQIDFFSRLLSSENYNMKVSESCYNETNGLFKFLKTNGFFHLNNSLFSSKYNFERFIKTSKDIFFISSFLSSSRFELGSETTYLNSTHSQYTDIKRIENLKNRVISIKRLFSTDSHEKGDSSIAKKIFELDYMLHLLLSMQDDHNDLQMNIRMASYLIEGFQISDLRRTDLKKISNLVKSKVSYSAGRRCSKAETDTEKADTTEMEVSRVVESEKLNNILEEIKMNKEIETILMHDRLRSLWEDILRKEQIIEDFLSSTCCLENYEKQYTNNLNNLSKIQELLIALEDTVGNNINKVCDF